MAIVPVIEGIIYPVFFGKPEAVSEDGKHGRLIRALKEHIQTVLVPGICLFEDGGFKLSETSDNSWISKIFLCQYIIEKVLHMNMPQVMDKADAVGKADTVSICYNGRLAEYVPHDQIRTLAAHAGQGKQRVEIIRYMAVVPVAPHPHTG